MSKESYVRGFCKVAEAAGVDSNELMKFAQQFKTDGWAPKGVLDFHRYRGSGAIPGQYFGEFFPMATTNPSEDIRELSEELYRVREKLEPTRMEHYSGKSVSMGEKERNWHKAHLESIQKVLDLAKDNNIPYRHHVLHKTYHDKMLSLTGTPQRVSAPVKK